jgi:hypothetical protein
MLALDEHQFDQDMTRGWRALAARPACALIAADLIHEYREARHKDSPLLFWHEAQVRAVAGQYQEAADLMEHAYKPDAVDKAGWNAYVRATISFLRKDRIGFDQAKSKLAAVQPPSGVGISPVVGGHIEADFADGSKRRIRWPPNIDVVEGLENCFGKPYLEAYADTCRQNKRGVFN